MPVLSTVPIKDINGVCKPHRTVIIDEKEIDAHSPECDEESQSFASNGDSQEYRLYNEHADFDYLEGDDNAALLDEEEARLR